MSDSRPTIPTAVAAIVRFWGLIILPTTPPEVLAATSRLGSMPGLLRRGLLQGREQCVRRGVRAGHRGAEPAEDRARGTRRTPPVPAIQVPIVIVWPERFMT